METESRAACFDLIRLADPWLALRARGLYIRDLLMTMNEDDARLKKLKFRAWRRGFREADLILGPFADRHVQSFSPSELDVFEELLEQPDQDLYAWIVGTVDAPAAFDGDMLNKIKAFRFEAHGDGGGPRGG